MDKATLIAIRRRLDRAMRGRRNIGIKGVTVGNQRVMNVHENLLHTQHGSVVQSVSLVVDAGEREFYAEAHDDMTALVEALESELGPLEEPAGEEPPEEELVETPRGKRRKSR